MEFFIFGCVFLIGCLFVAVAVSRPSNRSRKDQGSSGSYVGDFVDACSSAFDGGGDCGD
jgi:hypothetical protein